MPESCVHHWDCERDKVKEVSAICVKCGATTTFHNPDVSKYGPAQTYGPGALSGSSAYGGYGKMSRGGQN